MVRATDTKPNFIAWYKEVFGFTDAVAKAVYDKQLLQDKKTLTELSDSEIDSVIRAICWTLHIAKISAAQLKLAIFWIKHQDRTQCKVGIPANPLVRVTLATMMLLKTQTQLEDK
jgi:ribosomal protein S13